MSTNSACCPLIERCPLPMFSTEGKAHLLQDANPAFGHLCGLSRGALLGRPVAEVLPEFVRDGGLIALLDRVNGTGQAETATDPALPGAARGDIHWAYTVWAVPGDAERPVRLMVQLTDTTDAVMLRRDDERAHAELREMNRALMVANVKQHELAEAARIADASTKEREVQSAVLEERNRIAREIHDTLAQVFTGILLQLRVAERLAEQRPNEAWGLIKHVGELAQEGLAEARRSVWALQPQSREYSDLVRALTNTIERINTETAVQTKLYVHGAPRPLPPDAGLNLLRIAQEALTNALRHGQATIVWIDLTYEAERVMLRVQDDGRGFVVKRQADGGGFGLIGMSQRTERLGGLLTITSRPGRGTEIAVSVPLPAEPGSEEEK